MRVSYMQMKLRRKPNIHLIGPMGAILVLSMILPVKAGALLIEFLAQKGLSGVSVGVVESAQYGFISLMLVVGLSYVARMWIRFYRDI